MSVRTFIAVPIPSSVKTEIAKFQEKLRQHWPDEVRWVNVEMMHITLQFLGNVEESQIPDIAKAITQALQGSQHFEIKIQGAGAFPNHQKPRVIWIGIHDPDQGLQSLYQKNFSCHAAIWN